MNIATWNTREFGKKPRSEAAIHYIAEVLGQFDLIGVVELRDDLTDLGRVLQVLGPYWRAVYSDMIPDPGGNGERVAYVYDKRAAVFNGLAAEANPPRTKQGTEYLAKISWWRSPYMASFRAGTWVSHSPRLTRTLPSRGADGTAVTPAARLASAMTGVGYTCPEPRQPR